MFYNPGNHTPKLNDVMNNFAGDAGEAGVEALEFDGHFGVFDAE